MRCVSHRPRTHCFVPVRGSVLFGVVFDAHARRVSRVDILWEANSDVVRTPALARLPAPSCVVCPLTLVRDCRTFNSSRFFFFVVLVWWEGGQNRRGGSKI